MKKLYVGLLAIGLCFAALLGANLSRASIPLGGSIFPLTFITQQDLNTTDSFNQMESLIAQQAAPAPGLAGGVAAFNGSFMGNPIVMVNNQNQLISNIDQTSTGGVILINNSVGASTTLWPQTASILALGGNVGGATSEKILCSPSGVLIGTFPVSTLTSNFPANIYMSQASLLPGPALVSGCVAGDSIGISNVGSAITGATSLQINVPYVVTTTR